MGEVYKGQQNGGAGGRERVGGGGFGKEVFFKMIIDSSGHVGHPVNVDALILSSAAGFIKGGAHRHPP
ncbi:hypothetical protein ABD03_23785 [Enterobacter hormaechei]|nr:hypothetical protein ABD03_23785 [Enterobacter hormaechei]